MSFVHLHVHTNFSFGDGAGRIDELVDAARRLGMPALSVTDHDGLYGAVRFYQACKAAGVKPIVGVEISVESILAAPGALRGATGNDAAAGAKAITLGRGVSGGVAAAGPLAPVCGASGAAAASGVGEPAEEASGVRANSERECYPRRQPRVPYSGSRSASPTPGPAAADAHAPCV